MLEKIRKLTMKAVEESKYHPWEIDEIIMVGGGTKLSIVCKMIEKMTGKPLEHKINPDEAVVLGTAIQGALLEKDETVKDLVMTDICPYYLGLIIRDGGNLDINEYFDVLIPKNVTIPARATTVHFSKPALWGLDVCQSEDRCGTNPIPMGHISYRLPDVGTPRVEVHKTVIYDANGIMHVEIYIPSTDVTYEKTIVNDECEMTIEKAKERAKQLKYMNLSAKGNDKDNLLIARAERVYAECTGSIREHINSLIGLFETALNSGKQSDIKNARERLLDAVNRYDSEII